MTDKRLMLSTASSREEANTIASELVSRRLAACVNILGPIPPSITGRARSNTPKSSCSSSSPPKPSSSQFRDAIRELHSYQVPELISFTIDSGLESYLDWIAVSVRR